MKALHNHLILFDAECPMCNMYTKAFVAAGLLDSDGREAYQEYPADACPLLDRQRAVDEIALINRETGDVTYGIKSLFRVFANAMPLLKPVLQFAPFVWLMGKVYAFVSYNRRIIIPAKTDGFAWQPTFKLHYRVAYLVFAWAVTSCILTAYVHLIAGLLPQGNAYREYLICGGQIIFQGAIILTFAQEKVWAYLGSMMTISLGGALLLLPGIVAALWFNISPVVYALYFMAVAGTMFLEHIRRSGILNLGWALTISWATYRSIVLLLIVLLAK